MSREVQHREDAVPEVDDVGVFKELCRFGRARPKRRGVEATIGICGDQVPARRCITEQAAEAAWEIIDSNACERWVAEEFSFSGMRQARLELMQTTDVIEVGVRRDGQRLAGRDFGENRAQRREAESGIDQQIAVAAAYVPDVAADEGIDIRLDDLRDRVVDRADCKPGRRRPCRQSMSS